jgi:hypothetical protein
MATAGRPGSATPSGLISGFAGTQKTSGATASGTLTVKEGASSVTLTLVGSYTSGNFIVTSDGSGGTLVTDPPVPGGGPVLAGAMSARLLLVVRCLSQFAGVISGFDLGSEIDLRSLGFGSSSSAASWTPQTGGP